MKWGSLGAFLAMGGYGPYVWGSYGVTVILIALEVALLVARHRAARRQLPEPPRAPG
ncbi:MAG: heme exporter protein CcmD [Betaproteobacteria bacterium]|nr:heme exporter protein CcmD [Betaproteobacteria bacterium]